MKKCILALFIVMLIGGIARASGNGVIKTVQDAYEFYSLENYEDAAPLFEKAYNLTAKNGKNDILGLFKLAVYTGLSYRNMEDYKKASEWFDKALTVASKMNDKAVAAPILAYMAESERLAGNYDKAVSAYLRAVSNVFITQRDKSALYFGLAETYRLKGDYPKAKDSCDMAATMSGDFSAEQLKLSCDIIKGESFRIGGDYAAALQSFGMVLDLARARQYPDLIISALAGAGLTSETLGKNDAARANFEEALLVSLKNQIYDNVETVADKLITLSSKGNFTKQAEEITAHVESEDITDPFIKNALWRLISAYYKASGDNEKALDTAQNAYDELAATGQSETPAALYEMSSLMFTMGRYYSAVIKLDEGIQLGKASNYPEISKLYALKSECFFAMQKYDEAYTIMKEAAKFDVEFRARLLEMEPKTSAELNRNANPDSISIPASDAPDGEDNGKTIKKTDETPVG